MAPFLIKTIKFEVRNPKFELLIYDSVD